MADLLAVCKDLGADLERRWRDAGYDDARLAALAADALRGIDAPDTVDILARYHRLAKTGANGDFIATLFRTERFRIEISYAAAPSNSLRKSGWNGAFRILDGRCLYVTARFDAQRLAGWGVATGDLRLASSAVLSAGAIIPVGARDIHAALHLDRPTATLSIRAPRPHADSPGRRYLWPHFAIDAAIARSDKGRTAMLEFVAQIGQSGAFEPMLQRLLQRSTLRETIDIFLHPRVLQGDAARLERILAVAMLQHPAAASMLAATVHEERRRGAALAELIKSGDAQARLAAALTAAISDPDVIAAHMAAVHLTAPAMEPAVA